MYEVVNKLQRVRLLFLLFFFFSENFCISGKEVNIKIEGNKTMYTIKDYYYMNE